MSLDRGQAVHEVREKRTTANHLYLSQRVDIYIQESLSGVIVYTLQHILQSKSISLVGGW